MQVGMRVISKGLASIGFFMLTCGALILLYTILGYYIYPSAISAYPFPTYPEFLSSELQYAPFDTFLGVGIFLVVLGSFVFRRALLPEADNSSGIEANCTKN